MVKKIMNRILVAAFVIATILSCNKQEYYKDTGLQSGILEENIYEFIQQRPFLFDSLQQVIDLAGMKDILQNEEVTFFAPPDRALLLLMNNVNRNRYAQGKDSLHIADIPADIWRKYLSRYVFRSKYLLNDIGRIDFARIGLYPGQNIESYDGYIMNMGVIYDAYSGTQDLGPRTIYLTSVGDDLVRFPVANSEVVSSSNIQPKNGVIHALRGQQQFSFNTDFEAVVSDNVP